MSVINQPIEQISTPEKARVNQIGRASFVRAIPNFLLHLALLVALTQIFALDWTGEDGWWCTLVAWSGFICLSSRISFWRSILFGYVFGVIALASSFWWAQKMLAYTLNDEESWTPRLVFAVLILWEAVPFAVVSSVIAWSRARFATAASLSFACSVWILIENIWPRVFC